MNSGWRILDLTEPLATIDVERGAIVIETRDKDGGESVDRVPAADIALILLGTGVRFSSGVLHRLAQHDVVMMLCDWRGIPQAVSMPWVGHSRIAARQAAQARFSDEDSALFWQQIVQSKISGQAATLCSLKPRIGARLAKMPAQVQPGDITNVEGLSAREYFPALFGKNFIRDKNGGDRINAMLNYGYGILRGVGIRAVLSAGLVPALGVWHSHRANPFNLVSDLMEPFRPVVDHVVRNAQAYSSLKKPETKKLLASAIELDFGTGKTVVDEFNALARGYGRLVEGQVEELNVPAWLPGRRDRL